MDPLQNENRFSSNRYAITIMIRWNFKSFHLNRLNRLNEMHSRMCKWLWAESRVFFPCARSLQMSLLFDRYVASVTHLRNNWAYRCRWQLLQCFPNSHHIQLATELVGWMDLSQAFVVISSNLVHGKTHNILSNYKRPKKVANFCIPISFIANFAWLMYSGCTYWFSGDISIVSRGRLYAWAPRCRIRVTSSCKQWAAVKTHLQGDFSVVHYKNLYQHLNMWVNFNIPVTQQSTTAKIVIISMTKRKKWENRRVASNTTYNFWLNAKPMASGDGQNG